VSLSDGGAPRSAAKDDPVEEDAIAREREGGAICFVRYFLLSWDFWMSMEEDRSDTMSAMVRTMTSPWPHLRVNIDGKAPSVAHTRK
jgi:hypothetical protein